MNELLNKIAHCVEFGKINKSSPYPPDLRGEDGADELTHQALSEKIAPDDILKKALVPAMERVGAKFRENKIFVPQVLMSAKAMNTAIRHLKPFFQSGEVKRKGTFIIGTVAGDLHDIGKNLVAMMVEGNGFEVVDLGTDVGAERFIIALKEHPGSAIGISALLTTTMVNMGNIVVEVKKAVPGTKVAVGGAPLNEDFRKKIGADFYSPDPQGVVEYLNSITS
jgi:methanogenic corrinoid protein MtbC1